QHPPHGQSAQGSPLVPQIGSSADGASAGDSTVGSSQADGSPQHDGAGNAGPTAGGANPYGPAGARYASETPPPASGLATGAIPRVHSPQQDAQAAPGTQPPSTGAIPAAGHPGPAGPQSAASDPAAFASVPAQPGAPDQSGPSAQPGVQGQPGGQGQPGAQMPPGGPNQPVQRNRRRGRRRSGGRGPARRGCVAPAGRRATGRGAAVAGFPVAVRPLDQPVDGDAGLGPDRRPDHTRRRRDPDRRQR